MNECANPELIRSAQADHEARVRAHKQHCILLAVVTSPDVSAMLIDQAIALQVREKAAASIPAQMVDA